MNDEYKLTTDVDMNNELARATVDDIRYFEDKVKLRPWDKKAQMQLALIKKHFGVEE